MRRNNQTASSRFRWTVSFPGHTIAATLLICAVIVQGGVLHGAHPAAEITVQTDHRKKINPLIFGQNGLGHDSCTFSRQRSCRDNGKYSNLGAGQWDPAAGRPNPVMTRLTREAGLTFLRFPGGCGTHNYDWKKTIGPVNDRNGYLFGIDEFLALCEQQNIEPIITLSYFTGSDLDLTDLIEYLNHPLNAGNPNGGENWAMIRAANGHPEPYGVRFLELGNEVYHGDHGKTAPPQPEAYARRYIACRRMMKNIDPAIQLGAVLQGRGPGMTAWDEAVVSTAARELDFGIVHVYPVRYRSDSDDIDANRIFRAALAAPEQVKDGLEKLADQLRVLTGREVPLALTEYNGHFTQDKPVPYRHCLGNALLISDLLRVFLTTRAPILGANYWQLANSYWGLLYNDSYTENSGRYTKRPNYLVFQLFANLAGNKLLRTSVHAPAYRSEALAGVFATGPPEPSELSGAPPPLRQVMPARDWQTDSLKQLLSFSIPVRTDSDNESFSLSFTAGNTHDYYHTYQTLKIRPGRRYRVTAQIRTRNLNGANIYLAIQDSRGWKETGWQKSTGSVSGSSGWQNVEVVFQPPSETREIKIMIRCNRSAGSNGKAWIRNVVLRETGPAIRFPRATPLLSAVAAMDGNGETIRLIVINKNLTGPMSARITVQRGFELAPTARYQILNGPSVASTNENMQERVTIHHGEASITLRHNSFMYGFSPHSVTLLELRKQERSDTGTGNTTAQTERHAHRTGK